MLKSFGLSTAGQKKRRKMNALRDTHVAEGHFTNSPFSVSIYQAFYLFTLRYFMLSISWVEIKRTDLEEKAVTM